MCNVRWQEISCSDCTVHCSNINYLTNTSMCNNNAYALSSSMENKKNKKIERMSAIERNSGKANNSVLSRE